MLHKFECKKIDYKYFHYNQFKTTTMETPMNQENELTEAKNKIKELEEEIKLLKCELDEKTKTLKDIEYNMSSTYVENWTVSDNNGKKGEFSGNMYWIKGEGMVFYKNKTILEGSWDSTGEVIDGELRGTYNNELIRKWENGLEVDLEEDDDS